MKTIEERAKAFCEARICPECGDRKACDRKCLTSCIPTEEPYDLLVEFAKSERAELTRWNDPKEVLPKPMEYVLCKCVSGIYVVDFFDPRLGAFFCEDATYAKVVGWRPIHE